MKPYINGQLKSLESQAQKVGQQFNHRHPRRISSSFIRRSANLESLIKNHVFFSQFLTWLEQNTEANVYYTSMSFSSGDQITLSGVAKTAADVSRAACCFRGVAGGFFGFAFECNSFSCRECLDL